MARAHGFDDPCRALPSVQKRAIWWWCGAWGQKCSHLHTPGRRRPQAPRHGSSTPCPQSHRRGRRRCTAVELLPPSLGVLHVVAAEFTRRELLPLLPGASVHLTALRIAIMWHVYRRMGALRCEASSWLTGLCASSTEPSHACDRRSCLRAGGRRPAAGVHATRAHALRAGRATRQPAFCTCTSFTAPKRLELGCPLLIIICRVCIQLSCVKGVSESDRRIPRSREMRPELHSIGNGSCSV